MDKILINPDNVESCWEQPDACMVKTKTGKVWVCEKEAMTILTNSNGKLVELPLKRKGGKYGK